MSHLEDARFRATAGLKEGFGTTPQEALTALMRKTAGDAFSPIVIWPYNLGDAYFTEAQQARLQELKGRQEALTADEQAELEGLIAAAFNATIARTEAPMPAQSKKNIDECTRHYQQALQSRPVRISAGAYSAVSHFAVRLGAA